MHIGKVSQSWSYIIIFLEFSFDWKTALNVTLFHHSIELSLFKTCCEVIMALLQGKANHCSRSWLECRHSARPDGNEWLKGFWRFTLCYDPTSPASTFSLNTRMSSPVWRLLADQGEKYWQRLTWARQLDDWWIINLLICSYFSCFGRCLQNAGALGNGFLSGETRPCVIIFFWI